MKPGWKTSEFWVLIVFAVLNLLGVLAGLIPDPKWAGVAMAVLGAAYAVARGMAKIYGVQPPKELDG